MLYVTMPQDETNWKFSPRSVSRPAKGSPYQAKPLDISMDLQFGTFMCHCIMELHVFVTNDRYTIWICDKNTHVWVLKSQFHKNY